MGREREGIEQEGEGWERGGKGEGEENDRS